MNPQYQHIIAGVLAAIDAAKRGEEHERLNQMMIRTESERNRQAAFYASFRPFRPRQTKAIESPYLHFATDHYGAGGAVKAD
ncbi:hypothetical protein [Pragia fontium]|uniref:hypothetical protein n=1 Tax=Pragia fontium TaxID=82985 RepID=UPI00064A638A|nr:hypothetical protein [Pragia fontium]AKJ41768.1 hypothetical protein QQ39_06450 [Pragia fontium]